MNPFVLIAAITAVIGFIAWLGFWKFFGAVVLLLFGAYVGYALKSEENEDDQA